MEEVNKYIPWGTLVIGLLSAIAVWFRWRSRIIFIEPQMIIEMRAHIEDLEDRLDHERQSRRTLEDEITKYRLQYDQRIGMLIHDYETKLTQLRTTVNEQARRIKELERKNGNENRD